MKRIILMIISIVFLCINGCGYNKSGNNEDFEKKENTITEDKDGTLIKNEHVSEEKENTKEEDTDDLFEKEDIEGEKTWNDEYNNVLAREEYAESGRYMLINLNGDDIPELVIINGVAHQDGGEIFAWDGDSVYRLESDDERKFGNYGCFTYSDEGNVIQYYDYNDGETAVSCTAVLEWQGRKLYVLRKYETVCNMESLVMSYFVDDREISEKDYWEQIESIQVNNVFYGDCKEYLSDGEEEITK